LVGVARAVFF